MNRYDRSPTRAEIAAARDEEIDDDDIPELDESLSREAVFAEPARKERITLRVRRSALVHFRAQGRGYQTRINRVSESCERAQRRTGCRLRDRLVGA